MLGDIHGLFNAHMMVGKARAIPTFPIIIKTTRVQGRECLPIQVLSLL